MTDISTTSEVRFEWLSRDDIDEETLGNCRDLFNNHYGIYSAAFSRPGARVRQSIEMLRRLLEPDDSGVALAWRGDTLVAHAFAVRGAISEARIVAWVTQLVVHADYRHSSLSKRLLASIWGFSDHYAWGLVTANPYAVRALEKVTRRRCEPSVIAEHADILGEFVQGKFVWYLKDRELQVNELRSVIDTRFYVDHAEMEDMIARASSPEKPWKLGLLDEGQEWFACTLREQPEFSWTVDELEEQLVADAEEVRLAYERMAIDSTPGQKWAKSTLYEADFVAGLLAEHFPTTASILDFGCGPGRHCLELARRGHDVVGVDYVEPYIHQARRLAADEQLAARFMVGDCRTIDLGAQFDVGLCLYDVIGTFPTETDNAAILGNLARHIKPGGIVLLSVLNFAMTRAVAKHIVDRAALPSALHRLAPSKTMQESGDIFKPDHFVLEEATQLVYRKEQFDGDKHLPRQLVVRDRRYRGAELEDMCRNVGLRPLWVRHVHTRHWDVDLPPADPKAKEILLLARREPLITA